MSALTFAVFVFIAMFVAALAGHRLQRMLPKKFTGDATEAHVKAVLGMFSMMTAVVLGFVTADAKSSFDSAAKIVSDTASASSRSTVCWLTSVRRVARSACS